MRKLLMVALHYSGPAQSCSFPFLVGARPLLQHQSPNAFAVGCLLSLSFGAHPTSSGWGDSIAV